MSLVKLIVPLIKFAVVGVAVLAAAGAATMGAGFIGAPVPKNYWDATAYDLTYANHYAQTLLATVAVNR